MKLHSQIGRIPPLHRPFFESLSDRASLKHAMALIEEANDEELVRVLGKRVSIDQAGLPKAVEKLRGLKLADVESRWAPQASFRKALTDEGRSFFDLLHQTHIALAFNRPFPFEFQINSSAISPLGRGDRVI